MKIKRIMRISYTLLVITGAFLFSCKDPSEKVIENAKVIVDSIDTNPTTPVTSTSIQTNTKEESLKYIRFLKDKAQPSQKYTVSSSAATTVVGKRGTIISVEPSDLSTIDGKTPGKNITVEL